MFAKQWQPFGAIWSEMNRIQNDGSAVFRRSSQVAPWRFAALTYPRLNMWAEDDNLYVEAELPGLDHDDVEIYVDRDNQLTIKGQRKTPQQVESDTWHKRERAYGDFERIVELPEGVDADKVSAHFKRGVLTVVLPKLEEVKPHRIKVTGS